MPCRVAVTRDEPPDGPLTVALREAGLAPVACPVIAAEPGDEAAVRAAAASLDGYDWAVFASRRAVDAIANARGGAAWPVGVRTAAVGARTARALVDAGATPAPLVAGESGADALWTVMARADAWAGRRVLVPGVSGGRRTIPDGLRAAGALVTEVEAYRMRPRAPALVARDWREAAPEAAVIASPATARALAGAIGVPALAALSIIVAIGPTTADALTSLGLTPAVSPEADWRAAARLVAALAGRPKGGTHVDG